MVNPSSSSHIESFTTNRPPFFTKIDYLYQKTKMTQFLQSIDLDLWDVIENGPTIPSKLVDGVMVSKPKQEWDQHDRRNFQLNARVVYTLQCVIDKNEYNRISQYKSAKEIQRLLEVTHEGTNQVKDSKINLLVHSYELFFMKDNETIVEMVTRFIDIVMVLKPWERPIRNQRM